MELRQILNEPIHGYWDGGAKQTFTWSIVSKHGQDGKGEFAHIGSWEANHWFHVALGKTDKLTLANARRRLLAGMKRLGITGRFEYIEERR